VVTAVLPWERLGSKVGDQHLQRLAVVYVRQSTRQQVLDHQESTRLQYALVERAVALGWPADRVVVIDEDLGKSAASAAGRAGFQRLVTEITMGHVGLVLGIEMSRLARSGGDWYQLLELCALSGALLADADGVYDPAEYNDRLLLGLKGTMSEAELHLLKQRMQGGRLAKARRGELAIPLPLGYVRRASGEAALDPDEQVQTVVRLVFGKFAELGTLHGVLRWLVDHGIQLGIRLRSGPDTGELVWRRPNRMTLQCMLHNPVYAGIYAYGRRRVDPRRQLPGRPSTGRVVRAEAEWLVLLPGRLPAYISVEQYHANLARLAANAARAETPGVARAGSALLSGLARCGRCGRRMTVRYHLRGQTTQPEYVCARQVTDYGAGQRCQALAGACVDALVTEQVLAALARPRWRSPCTPHSRSRPSGPSWNGSGPSAWNAPPSPPTGPGAATAWPSRSTAWSPASWRPTGKPRSPTSSAYARTTTASVAPARVPSRPPSSRPSPPSPATSRPVGRAHHHRPRPQTAHPRARRTGHHHHPGPQRTRRGHDHLGRRPHHPQPDCPPGRPPGPAQLLPPAPAPRPRARRGRPPRPRHHPTPPRRGLPPRQGPRPHRRYRDQPAPARTGLPPTSDRARPAPPPGQAPGPDEWWLDDLATELGMPPITLHSWLRRGWVHGRKETTPPHRWILHANQHELAELRQRRTRPPGWYTRRRWADPTPPTRNDQGQAASSHVSVHRG
jgi:DNA invertase Pin-like site-specific DNA recombinase